MDISDDDIDNDRRKKRPKKSKWEERQDLKWENLTKKCLYEAAKEDMANGVYKSRKECARFYDIVPTTLGVLIKENREFIGDGKKSEG